MLAWIVGIGVALMLFTHPVESAEFVNTCFGSVGTFIEAL